MTRLVALLGSPVGHSLSPRLHNAAFRAVGREAIYLPLEVSADDVAGLLRGVARAGGCGNVTLPHKAAAAQAVEVPTAAVLRTGAANTFWLEEGRIHGDNTDVEGFRRALSALPVAANEPVLLLGAGGAARAVLAALESTATPSVQLWNRTPERAHALVRALSPLSVPVEVLEGEAPRPGDRVPGLVVNATSLGLRSGDPLPLPVEALPPGCTVLDLVYRPEETPWVRAARAAGHPAADGGTMLLEQGMAAWERWWGDAAPRACYLDELAAIRREARSEGRAP